MKYDTVIFDLDGTLLNTLDDLTDAVNYALKRYQMPTRTLDEIRSFVGNGIYNLLCLSVPDGSKNLQFETVYTLFCEYYQEHCNDKTRPYPGVIDLLKQLKNRGIHLAIVSNKADFGVKELKEIYFEEYMEAAIGEREGIERKPAPDTVYQALREMGVTGEKAVYVGDSDVDIKTAENAGIPCISVTWGFRDREFLLAHGAAELADDIEQVLEKITDNPYMDYKVVLTNK